MTLHRNRPDVALLGDITKISADEVRRMARIPQGREIDVMFGGPPCQAFSTAGARRAFEDPRGNVFLRYLDLASELKPRYLVIENVRGLLSTPFPVESGGKPIRGGVMRYILNKLEEMGYGVSFNLYNAANFGAARFVSVWSLLPNVMARSVTGSYLRILILMANMSKTGIFPLG